MGTHKDLDVWKCSMCFVKKIYELTKYFPKYEQYSLTDQIRRCAVSVPSNIAEGAARSSNKEYIRFIYISLGSLSEIETQLIIANELKYYNNHEVLIEVEVIRKKLLNLVKYLKTLI